MILWFNSSGETFINCEIVDAGLERRGIQNPDLWCDKCLTGYFYVGF